MFGFLQNPNTFAIALALLTATLAHLYARTTERDKEVQRKVFWKTLVIGIISGLILTWLVHGRQEPIATEPFNPEV